MTTKVFVFCHDARDFPSLYVASIETEGRSAEDKIAKAELQAINDGCQEPMVSFTELDLALLGEASDDLRNTILSAGRPPSPQGPPQEAFTTTLTLERHGIVVTLGRRHPEGRYQGGTITSDLHVQGMGDDIERYNAAVDALESFILAAACAGVCVIMPAFLQAIDSAVDAMANHLM